MEAQARHTIRLHRPQQSPAWTRKRSLQMAQADWATATIMIPPEARRLGETGFPAFGAVASEDSVGGARETLESF